MPQIAQGFALFQPSRALTLPLMGLALTVLLMGCGKGGQEHLADARQQLASSAYAEAIAAADAGLQTEPGEVTAWGLELVKLEAMARGGQGEAVVAQLEHMAQAYAKHLTAAEYSGTAHQLKEVDQGGMAIKVLDMGSERFPEDTSIAQMIEDVKAAAHSDVSPEELKMLRQLGYIE
ncbi:MAG: hypothetical protein JRC77_01280 [Deltaproteobacteria bacterium]|nr:hypothetical protein [Deltaproteobacteria bacterium]